MFKLIHKPKEGFTLIELVMVIVIIGILAAIIVPRFVGQRAQAEIATTKANLESLRTAIDLYFAKEGSYPDALADLVSDYMRRIPTPTVRNADGDLAATAFTYSSTTGAVTIASGTDEDANGDTIADY